MDVESLTGTRSYIDVKLSSDDIIRIPGEMVVGGFYADINSVWECYSYYEMDYKIKNYIFQLLLQKNTSAYKIEVDREIIEVCSCNISIDSINYTKEYLELYLSDETIMRIYGNRTTNGMVINVKNSKCEYHKHRHSDVFPYNKKEIIEAVTHFCIDKKMKVTFS